MFFADTHIIHTYIYIDGLKRLTLPCAQAHRVISLSVAPHVYDRSINCDSFVLGMKIMFALNEKGCAKRPCSDFGGAIGT